MRWLGIGPQHGSRRLGVAAQVGLVAGAVTLGLLGPAQAGAAAADVTPLVSGWIPSWATTTGQDSLSGNDDISADISPFWYSATASKGAVTISSSATATARATVVAALRAQGLAVIPSVSDGSAARAMAAILTDPDDRAAHAAQLVDLVTSNGLDGIELDYEKFAFSDGSSTWATTRPAWVTFIAELGKGLHAAGKRLALAVPPMYDGTRTSSSGYWVYDYAGVAPYVDSLRIMTYDYSVSRPGPIAPLSFLKRTLSYAVTAFPAERIRMGVPAYGRLWIARKSDGTQSITGTCPTSGVPGTTSFTTASAASYLASVAGEAPTVTFNSTYGESTAAFSVKYSGTDKAGEKTSCVVDHVAWWVDSRGVAARLPLVKTYGLAGIAVWHIGGMDSASWSVLRDFAAGWTPPTGSGPTEPEPTDPPAPVTRTTPTVVAGVSTTRPAKGATVRFSVKLTPVTTGVTVKRQMLVSGHWKTLSTAVTGSKGKARFAVTWPKARVTRTYRFVATKSPTLNRAVSQRLVLRTR